MLGVDILSIMKNKRETSQEPENIAESATGNATGRAIDRATDSATGRATGNATGRAIDRAIEDAIEMCTNDTQKLILAEFKNGMQRTQDIADAVPRRKRYIQGHLKVLREQGMILQVKKGWHAFNPDFKDIRAEARNAVTINRLINLYDKVLAEYSVVLEARLASDQPLEEKVRALNAFKTLVSTVDTLMKRWYLVHRGYDSNARQAQEDAKAKTAKAEKESLANAPPEDRIMVVGHYHDDVQKIWDNLPPMEQEKRTV